MSATDYAWLAFYVLFVLVCIAAGIFLGRMQEDKP